jgi:hypothetical protein
LDVIVGSLIRRLLLLIPEANLPRGWAIMLLAVGAWLIIGLVGLTFYGLATLLLELLPGDFRS